MDTNSNKYTFIYAALMVIIAAAILSSAAIVLKKPQQKNVEIEKKQNILTSVKKGLEANEADDKTAYIESEYSKYITTSYVVNSKGDKIDGDAFTVDLNKEQAKAVEERKLPVFECKDDDGSVKYVLPIRGKGLWGPIWGYIALENDMNTIFGANFDHKGETPGLGAEINQTWFSDPFAGKKIFNKQGVLVSIKVTKGGAAPGDIHAVDAISGGTITSDGVTAMISDCLATYENFLKNKNNEL
ncbi:MAG: NADH:ubiquinone reductase (Na(+)-transporting) subunit C [Salinivirgaceae bacterium]|jgi:Na+-transporting NADH:ubiquinone oxidoreductase subunit C|nr:NADH:ubiquinone reductase (Na(+)-transporting) subunit C [Salinivirgaceae bacterium]